MTPTLKGRLQNRVFLLGTLGVAITFFFGLAFRDFGTPYMILLYVAGLGLGWELLYYGIQLLRWDRDWPPTLAVLGGILEAGVLWLLIDQAGLPGVPQTLTAGQFAAHYTTVFLITFLAQQGPLRVLMPRWRFRGGEWF